VGGDATPPLPVGGAPGPPARERRRRAIRPPPRSPPQRSPHRSADGGRLQSPDMLPPEGACLRIATEHPHRHPRAESRHRARARARQCEAPAAVRSCRPLPLADPGKCSQQSATTGGRQGKSGRAPVTGAHAPPTVTGARLPRPGAHSPLEAEWGAIPRLGESGGKRSGGATTGTALDGQPRVTQSCALRATPGQRRRRRRRRPAAAVAGPPLTPRDLRGRPPRGGACATDPEAGPFMPCRRPVSGRRRRGPPTVVATRRHDGCGLLGSVPAGRGRRRMGGIHQGPPASIRLPGDNRRSSTAALGRGGAGPRGGPDGHTPDARRHGRLWVVVKGPCAAHPAAEGVISASTRRCRPASGPLRQPVIDSTPRGDGCPRYDEAVQGKGLTRTAGRVGRRNVEACRHGGSRTLPDIGAASSSFWLPAQSACERGPRSTEGGGGCTPVGRSEGKNAARGVIKGGPCCAGDQPTMRSRFADHFLACHLPRVGRASGKCRARDLGARRVTAYVPAPPSPVSRW